MASNSVPAMREDSFRAPDVDSASSINGDGDSVTELHKAVFHDDRENVLAALERGVNVSEQDKHGG